jgi:hypothetical protein
MNNIKVHREDWVCNTCNNRVYGNTGKITCICGQTKWNSKNYTKNTYTWRIGDKLCSNCNEWNFKSKNICKKCKQNI